MTINVDDRFATEAEIVKTGRTTKPGFLLGFTWQKNLPVRVNYDEHLLIAASPGSKKSVTFAQALLDDSAHHANKINVDVSGEHWDVTPLKGSIDGVSQYRIGPGAPGKPCHDTNPFAGISIEDPNWRPKLNAITRAIMPMPETEFAKNWPQAYASTAFCDGLCPSIVQRFGHIDFQMINFLFKGLVSGSETTWGGQLNWGLDNADRNTAAVLAEIESRRQLNRESHIAPTGLTSAAMAWCNEPQALARFSGDDHLPSDFADPKKKVYSYLCFSPEEFDEYRVPINAYLAACSNEVIAQPKARPLEINADELGQLSQHYALFFRRLTSLYRKHQILMRGAVQYLEQIDRIAGKTGSRADVFDNVAVRAFMGLTSQSSAKYASELSGVQDTPLHQGVRNNRERDAVRSILDDECIFDINRELTRFEDEGQFQRQWARPIISESEALNLGSDQMLVYIKGLKPVILRSGLYWKRAENAGLYLPNHFYADDVEVQVKNWRGKVKSVRRPAITATPPAKFRDLPQYQKGGAYQYIAGFKPK